MRQVEVLREVKQAEAEVNRLKEEASRQAAQILRDAERRANEVIEKAKEDAESDYQSAVEGARQQVAQEREKLVAKGQSDAETIRNQATGAAAKKAVDTLLERFNARIRG